MDGFNTLVTNKLTLLTNKLTLLLLLNVMDVVFYIVLTYKTYNIHLYIQCLERVLQFMSEQSSFSFLNVSD